MTSLPAFNALDPADAAALLRPCLGVDRWVDTLVRGRPYATVEELYATARTAAHPLAPAEVEAALAHHPRIGQRAAGRSAEAALSRSEQAGLGLDDEVAARLAEGNRAYEEKFGRVFLIRAAGRSSAEVLSQLQTRLDNDVDTEEAVVAEQLRQIALVRLAQAVG